MLLVRGPKIRGHTASSHDWTHAAAITSETLETPHHGGQGWREHQSTAADLGNLDIQFTHQYNHSPSPTPTGPAPLRMSADTSAHIDGSG
jgi:hypothetical protein